MRLYLSFNYFIVCVDRQETHCELLKSMCSNPDYKDYLKANCAKTCDLCGT